MRDTASILGTRAFCRGGRRLRLAFVGMALSTWALAGCRSIGLEEQRYLARPGMQFGEQRAAGVGERMASQLEPGRVISGGAQASVCPACR